MANKSICHDKSMFPIITVKTESNIYTFNLNRELGEIGDRIGELILYCQSRVGISYTAEEIIKRIHLPMGCHGPGVMEYSREPDKQLLKTYMLQHYRRQLTNRDNVDRLVHEADVGIYKSGVPGIPDMLIVRWYNLQCYWNDLRLIDIFYRYPTHIERLSLPINPHLFWASSKQKSVNLKRQAIAMENAMRTGYTPPKITWLKHFASFEYQIPTEPELAWWRNSIEKVLERTEDT